MLLTVLLLVSGCNQQPEFQSVFNGTNLEGWVVKSKDADKGKQYWFVEDSCLVANSLGDSTHDYVWLQYDRSLRDFILRFEFQAYRGINGNSGVQVRSRYDEEEQWLNGPQVDIHPPGPWRTGMMWDETRGYQRWIFPDLRDRSWVEPEMALTDPSFYYAGDTPEWNRMEINVAGNQVQAWLNDQQVTDFNGDGILDDSIHLAKKVGTEGYILLQIHMKDQLLIRFRNIELKEL